MGKLTLFLVLAAVGAGTLLTMSARRAASDTARSHAETQQDALARQIAESGRNVVLASIMGPDRLRDPGITRQQYGGGTYEVTYEPTDNARQATITVRGTYGGATHTIRGTYAFDPMDYPGPIWLDVPYATAFVSPGASVSGGADQLASHFDRRQFDELNIGMILPLGAAQAALQTALGTAGSTLQTSTMAGLLDDLNVSNAEELYHVAMSAMGPHDVTYTGPVRLLTTLSAGGADRVTRVTGDLTIAPGAHLSGSGALVVEGALVAEAGSRLTWDGLVIVRAPRQLLNISLLGDVRLTGGLVVAQQAFPPGGHIDLTINLTTASSGLTAANPAGLRAGPWGRNNPYPFYQHKHRFDLDVPEGRTIYFAEHGRDRHEHWTAMRAMLRHLGSEQIYLELARPDNHGHSTYMLDVAGMDTPLRGTVRQGFGTFSGAHIHRTQTFRASDLRSFIVDVRSLRNLKQAFDGNGCAIWPICVGDAIDRRGSFSVRIVRASTGAVMYEASPYWHLREDEAAEHAAAEAAWRASLTSGGTLGTTLRLGSQARIHYAAGPIVALAEKLGFNGNQLILLDASSTHVSAAQASAAARAAAAGTGTAGPGPTAGAGTAAAAGTGTAAATGAAATGAAASGTGTGTDAGTGAPPGMPRLPFYVCMPNGQTRLVSTIQRYVSYVLQQGGTIGACS